MKYIVCRGCPASGKSTWAKSQGPNYVIVNRDDKRRKLFNFGQWNEYKFTNEKETLVTKEIRRDILLAAEDGIDVIDDNTNLNPKYYDFKNLEDLGYEIVIKDFFDVHLHELIERNLNREFSVPEDVIHRMFRAQLEIQGRVITSNPDLPDCIIVDVDGTIADMGKGEKWGRSPFDWHKVGQDKPKQNVIKVVQSFINDFKNPQEKIIFLTGRDGIALEDTKKWIVKNVFLGFNLFNDSLDFSPEIYIRTAGDSRPDCVIKEEILRKHVLPRYNVSLAIDDRNQMVDHWRALGLECWQVAAGRF